MLKYIKGLAGEGETVKVRRGYARNYLFPRNVAIPVNRANKKQIEALRKAREVREEQEREAAQTLAEKLQNTSIAISVKTGDGGKMFGSVTAQHIIDRLAEDGLHVDKKQMDLKHPIKELGKHEVTIKVQYEGSIKLPVEVVSENPIGDVS